MVYCLFGWFGRNRIFNQRLNTLLCHSTKQKIRFIRFMCHYFDDTWVLFKFTNNFSTRADHLYIANPVMEQYLQKKLFKGFSTRLLLETILVLSSISEIFFNSIFLWKERFNSLPEMFIIDNLFFSRLLKKHFFSLRKRDTR